MIMSMYKRTEGDTVTFVFVREAMDEVNYAMLGGKSAVRTMSSGRRRHDIEYRDGRRVIYDLVDVPPRVRVTDAPGYTDFDAVLLGTVAVDSVRVAVVDYEWEGAREIAVVPASCVSLIKSSATQERWTEACDWIVDAYGDDMNGVYLWTEDAVRRFIERNYPAGWDAFVTECCTYVQL